MNITKKQFQRYVSIQLSGVTNMYDRKTVMALSGLTKEQVTFIMENYEDLYNKLLSGKEEEEDDN